MHVNSSLVRWLLFILIIALSAYPIIELTRVIVVTEFIRHIHPEVPIQCYIVEIALMWSMYLGMLRVVSWLLFAGNPIPGNPSNNRGTEVKIKKGYISINNRFFVLDIALWKGQFSVWFYIPRTTTYINLFVQLYAC